ncbi:hypothetical protein [Candidatus Pantoea floridensis]|nr:hypothetical protein [Pantoea floridensis]
MNDRNVQVGAVITLRGSFASIFAVAGGWRHDNLPAFLALAARQQLA